MAKYWKNPPKDKKEVRKKEEKYPHLRKAEDYKENCQHLHRFNKTYREKFDINNQYQFYSDVSKYMETFDIYKNMRFLEKNGYFTIDYIGNRKIIPSFEVEEELFRREMCTFRDWIIWENDKSREYAKRNIAAAKKRSRRFYIEIPDRKSKMFFGEFDIRKTKLARDVATYLLSNSYIFEKTSPYYMKDSQIRTFVKKNCATHSFRNINLKDYVLSPKMKNDKIDK